MPTTPVGRPAWSRTATVEYYGGHPDKRNYMSQGAINAKTDVSAEQINRLAADFASVVRTAPLAVLIVQCNDSSPAPPTVLLARMQSGVTTTTYEGDAPPSGFPTLVRVSDGACQIVFPTTLTDDFGVEETVDIRGVTGAPNGSNADFSGVAQDPNSDGYNERVTCTIDNAGAVADALFTVELY